MFDNAMRAACERYRPAGRLAYHFARGKLRRDPVYRAVLEAACLPGDGVLLDLGCGGGLLLALLAEARERGGPNLRLVGVETRPKAAEVARTALGGDAVILTGDVRSGRLPAAQAIALLDVLSMMPSADQEALLRVLVEALAPGGVLLLRDVDAASGWRFQTVRAANRFKAWVLRTRGVAFCFRTQDGWRGWLEAAGLKVEVRPMGQGTPFGNVLFVATKPRS